VTLVLWRKAASCESCEDATGNFGNFTETIDHDYKTASGVGIGERSGLLFINL
jgi:hypothetical protein